MHPRGADLLEVMRRWEDIRSRRLLTSGQIAKFRALKPGSGITALIDEEGGYVFRDVSQATIGTDTEGRSFRAFLFGDGGRTVVQFWCADNDRRAFYLPAGALPFVWRDEYVGKALTPERTADGLRIVAEGRQYLFFDAGERDVRVLLERAVPEGPAKGVKR